MRYFVTNPGPLLFKLDVILTSCKKSEKIYVLAFHKT